MQSFTASLGHPCPIFVPWKNRACLFKSLPIRGCPSPTVTPTSPSLSFTYTHTHTQMQLSSSTQWISLRHIGMQWPNVVGFIKDRRMWTRGQNTDAQCSIQPRCNFWYLWSHDPGGLLLQDDFPPPTTTPLPLSLTEAYTTTWIVEKQLTIQANPSNHLWTTQALAAAIFDTNTHTLRVGKMWSRVNGILGCNYIAVWTIAPMIEGR